MICEICSKRPARWHQMRPVERWLCLECAHADHRETYPGTWQGELHPILVSTDGQQVP